MLRFYFVQKKNLNLCLKYMKYLYMYIFMNDIKNYFNNLKYFDKIIDRGFVIELFLSFDNVKVVYCQKWIVLDV